MVISLGKNISSQKAQRQLSVATDSLSRIYEQLSSAQRINKASDDAAGLAIAEDLNSKSRIYSQALRNVNDGISVHSIASNAISTLTDITTRLQELSQVAGTMVIGQLSFSRQLATETTASTRYCFSSSPTRSRLLSCNLD